MNRLSVVFLSVVLTLFGATANGVESAPEFHLLDELTDARFVSHSITVPFDPVFKSTKRYRAYALTPVIKELASKYPGDPLQARLIFSARDGYQVTMSYQDALAETGFIAYSDLAATDADWLTFQSGAVMATPAPYYLVWPQQGLDTSRYPWPYQLVSIRMQSAEDYFAAAKPQDGDRVAMDGFDLYTRYCISCHGIRGAGGNLAPDLLEPQPVTQRYSADILRKIIVNAESFFGSTPMPVFADQLTEPQVDSILTYLQAMQR